MGILLGALTLRPLWYASVLALGFALLVVLAFYLKSLTVT
ncbi:MAG: hypothetical protein AVDCRST_MAG37-1369 [uncultured Rubrobacteraceae bacterium]|uniref:Uncharacterized protein n=1 Tax=uncultured Rubrobacteraceae bacterium TaxID=349277 RepID=A0A6J4QDK1_9ACTN|nr:MAG: hypothetical protein AVDCRST_MAG37-1369 [uncultured Rubrobacteraceae bacterium]